MRVLTYFSALEAEGDEVTADTAVVIDVIRATSSIVEALANGARAIYPTVSSEDAIKLANTLGREDTLLCGERKGLKIEGFDLGNSPREYARETVGGKRLVMSTTNGTRAFAATHGAKRIIVLSFLNLGAVASELAKTEGEVALVCAGKDGRFSLDDALCAGLLLRMLAQVRGGNGLDLDDASRTALSIADVYPLDADFLRSTAAGAALVEIGLAEDLLVCAERDRHGFVPELIDRMIRIPEAAD
ncbi:MAG: 2-phosphosulfolactate phosphatase [Gemmatimonadota bacterium]